MLRSLASLCYRRRRLVLVAWVAALIGVSALASAAGGDYSQEFRLPDTDSQEAIDLLERAGSDQRFVEGQVVVQADAGIDDAATQAVLDDLVAGIEGVDQVAGVRSPSGEGPTWAVSPTDPTIGYAQLQFDVTFPELDDASLAAVEDLAEAASTDGLAVELGGNVFADQGPPGGTAEIIGLIAAVFILLVAFGSVVAMGLPIGTALFGLFVGFGLVGLLSQLTSVPEFGTQLAAMIGIGVGIDYALFIVTRYRQGLANGLDPEASVMAAVDTAGRAVLFAGTTVVISLAGMLLIGIEFVGGLGLAAASVVLVTMVTSVTLLPALLGFAGRSIDRLSLPFVRKAAEGGRHGFWYRWSRTLQRRPWPAAIAGFAVLLLLAAPVLSMRLGSTDAGNRPVGDTTRDAYDLLAEGFGPGFNARLLVVGEVDDDADLATMQDLSVALNATEGVALATPAVDREGVGTVVVFPTTDAQDEATVDTLARIRDDVIPATTAGTGVEVHVGGITAVFEDLSSVLQQRLPVFIGVVLGLSFLLLMVVFRSVLVPIKAVVMNLLSIGAAYGLIVAVFQWGWAADLVGIGKEGPIESFIPMMMFAILFGLSMDYEVFLLTRIKEEYDRTGDNGLAVADGLSATARVITAAALIMVTVFGSFVFTDDRLVKMFGMGLAAAILIDATIVRMVLVPATMELLGRTNWWFPRWLSWLPTIHVEGSAEDIEATEPHEGPYGSEPDERDGGGTGGARPEEPDERILVGDR